MKLKPTQAILIGIGFLVAYFLFATTINAPSFQLSHEYEVFRAAQAMDKVTEDYYSGAIKF